MIVIAELSGEKEIIFPEICALTIGAWISERQPWNCNKRKMFFLVSVSSLFGMLTAKYLGNFPLIIQVCSCFAFTTEHEILLGRNSSLFYQNNFDSNYIGLYFTCLSRNKNLDISYICNNYGVDYNYCSMDYGKISFET